MKTFGNLTLFVYFCSHLRLKLAKVFNELKNAYEEILTYDDGAHGVGRIVC